jgi:hypothetical protein
MSCITGLPAADCALAHWCPALDGRAESDGWRAPCPAPGCGIHRVLHYRIRGRTVRWSAYCPHHDADALRPVLRKLLGDCLPSRLTGPAPVDHADLVSLALAPMPPMSLRLALLEIAGMSTGDALDKLGVRRENRSRVITGRIKTDANTQVRPRSTCHQN